MEYDVKKCMARELNKFFDNNPKITKKEFAERFGVSSVSVIRWLTEVNAPAVELIPAICDYIGISVDQFFGHSTNTDEKEKKLLEMYRDDESFKNVVNKLIG